MVTYQIEPPFCYAHCQQAPCLACLVPEVMKEMSESKYSNLSPVFFTPPNMDEN